MSVSERGYLSIGEVLGLLQEEFPDVTISKIRFLESQGLIEPERTHSGYRKFYGPDVERLRFILREQRERYLPLRVIRDRLDAGPADDSADDDPEVDALDADAGATVVPFVGPASVVTPEPVPSDAGHPPANGEAASAPVAAVAPPVVVPPVVPPVVVDAEPAEPHVPLWLRKAPPGVQQRPVAAVPAAAGPPDDGPDPTVSPATPAAEAAPMPVATTPMATTPAGTANLPTFDTDAQFTLEELASAADLAPSTIRDLESYGLLTSRVVGRTAFYDAGALAAARLAAGFLRHGIEPRHLKVYKTFVERETALFEQVISPFTKQRNPRARAQASETLHELAGLGSSMRALFMAQAVRDLEP